MFSHPITQNINFHSTGSIPKQYKFKFVEILLISLGTPKPPSQGNLWLVQLGILHWSLWPVQTINFPDTVFSEINSTSNLTYLGLEHLVVQLEQGHSGHAHIPQETLDTAGRPPPPLTRMLLQQQGQVAHREEPLTLEVQGAKRDEFRLDVGKLCVGWTALGQS